MAAIAMDWDRSGGMTVAYDYSHSEIDAGAIGASATGADGDLADMLAARRTALAVIDIQNDFAGPSGVLKRNGADLAPAEEAIDRIEDLISAARAAGAVIAFIRVITSPETDSAALTTFYARKGQPGEHAICRKGDSGSDYYRVRPEPGDIEIQKTLYDSFHDTDLERRLLERGIDTLAITGMSTDCCVDATARAAFHRNFNVFIVSDACAAYDPELHTGTLRALEKNYALLIGSEAAVAVWPGEGAK